MIIPLVSIILPTYNGNYNRISQSIDSVIDQTYTNRELIIINDASINDIEKIILQYVKKDKRIKYHKNEKNMERSYSKNRGIFLSQGKYIAFIDDDDKRVDNNKLYKQVEFLEKNSDYTMVGCKSIIEINEQGDQTGLFNNRTSYEEIKKNLLTSNQFVQSSVCARRNVIQLVGGFPLTLHLAEDYYLWLLLGIMGKVTNVDSSVSYRNRMGNSTNTKKIGMFLSNVLMTFIFRSYYPGFWTSLIQKIIYFLLPKYVSHFLLNLFKKGTLKL